MSENTMTKLVFSLFCPKNDQHQFLMTISIQIKGKDYENQVITKGEIIWSSQLILLGKIWRSHWKICMWILELNGLTESRHYKVEQHYQHI